MRPIIWLCPCMRGDVIMSAGPISFAAITRANKDSILIEDFTGGKQGTIATMWRRFLCVPLLAAITLVAQASEDPTESLAGVHDLSKSL